MCAGPTAVLLVLVVHFILRPSGSSGRVDFVTPACSNLLSKEQVVVVREETKEA